MANDDTVTEIFADSVLTVTLANGVFRLVLAQQGENNKTAVVGRLLVPANQMPVMLQGMTNAMNTLFAKGREQARRATDSPADPKTAPATDTPRGRRKK